MLIHFGATPVLVFDGAALPMKADTHADRRARREDALQKAESAMAAGNLRTAEEWYQKACPVTPEMARKVIRQCRKINVEYVVAPYEADAQLAWMMQTGYVDSVITEDSDLLVYGASRVFYKMTKNGDGDLYETKNLPALDTVSMLNFTEDMFVYMCVCSGCDFFKGVQGLGIRKSHALVRKYRTLGRIIQAIRHDRRFSVSKSFTVDYARACLVFRHQTVYDIRQSRTVHLRDLDDVAKGKLPSGVLTPGDDGDIDISFLGVQRDAELAKRIAEGLVHPSSLQEYDEPLDAIERPVARKKRPRSFPDAAILPLSTTSKKEKRSVKGFQVHPATSGSLSFFSAVPNLRQRLAGGSRSFNPRRTAASFNARITAAKKDNPMFSSHVWDKFRRQSGHSGPKTVNTSCELEDGTRHNGANDHAEMVRTYQEGTTGDNGNDDRDESSFDPLMHAIQTPSKDESDAKQPKLCAPYRVDALNRAVGRFASDPLRDKKFKFQPPQDDRAPPSPDRDAYSLFEQIDEDLSRDPDDSNPGAEKDSSYAGKESVATTQVRVSRFFPRKSTDDGPKSDPRKQKRGQLKELMSARARLPSDKSLGSANFRKPSRTVKRGATGKKVRPLSK